MGTWLFSVNFVREKHRNRSTDQIIDFQAQDRVGSEPFYRSIEIKNPFKKSILKGFSWMGNIGVEPITSCMPCKR